MTLCMGVRSEALTSVTVNITVFLHVMSCCMVDWYRSSGATCSCTLKMETADSSEMSVPVYLITRCHIPEMCRKSMINVE
jgi:hypothetical protein